MPANTKTFKELMDDHSELGDEYTEYLKSKGKNIPEEPDWEGFRKSSKSSAGLPAEAPSDLLDVHAKLRSGLLGNVVGTVTDTVGGVTEGLTGEGGLLGGVTGGSGGSKK